ncbi:MAG TPA: hypothetical protein VLL48_11240, partial [Longimicrobiales bacterium]|nr:hypothetical protein [Longimicrobiales bacterium]
IVAGWYRRNLGTEFETAGLPVLYHEYVGHDNNRDWFMILQPETEAVTRQLWHEWFPQIVYNHHQTGPFPSRIFIPPFTDPMNPDIPAMVMRGINLVGTAMGNRFDREGKPGVVSRVQYSVWWNGGMRTAPYFHNQIGILTETNLYEYATPHFYPPESLPAWVGSRRGGDIPSDRPSVFYPNPWRGGWWRIGDAVDYMMTGSMAVADIGAELREDWLHGMWLMGRQAIEAGEAGRPFAYVIPEEQWDEGEARAMVEVLRRGAVEVHRATSDFEAGGERYPAGTWVAFAAQPFRAHLMDLMEPQEYPDRRLYPGGPPDPPYDLAGWTLPIQMGVEVRRVDEPFQAETRPVDETGLAVPPGRVSGSGPIHLLSPRQNASYVAVARLMEAGAAVTRTPSAIEVGGRTWPPGTYLVQAESEQLEAAALDLGLDFVGAGSLNVAAVPIRRPRIGLYKSHVASMDEGWTRWLLEQYGLEYETLTDSDVRVGNLSRFHAIVLPDQEAQEILNGHPPETMPPEYVGGMGSEGAAALDRWVRGGGTLVALDHASNFAIDQ